MSENGPASCLASLSTSIALIDQFSASLSTPSTTPSQVPTAPSDSLPPPLLLLKASATSLKSSVTKVSLLAITAPFTPTAVTPLLKALNDSVLPSLVTATLLTTSTNFPDSFCTECRALSRNSLRDLQSLLLLVQQRAKDTRPKREVGVAQKQSITEATGKVWEGCDALEKFAKDGVPGFVVTRAKQWLELMKDAVKELQEWDPEEEVHEDDIFGNVQSDDENIGEDKSASTTVGDADRATISAGVKDQTLKVLSRIPQSVHVVIKQRLEKLQVSPAVDAHESNLSVADGILNQILTKTRTISECIDESAEAMYMGDLELCLRMAGQARAITIEVVEVALNSTPASSREQAETKEDKYLQRALQWIQQVDTGYTAKDVKADSKSSTKTVEKQKA